MRIYLQNENNYVDVEPEMIFYDEIKDIYAVLASYYFQDSYYSCLGYYLGRYYPTGEKFRNIIKKLLIKVAFDQELDKEEQEMWERLVEKYNILTEVKGAAIKYSQYTKYGNTHKKGTDEYYKIPEFNLPLFLQLLFMTKQVSGTKVSNENLKKLLEKLYENWKWSLND